MSTHNIQFLNICFLSYLKNFVGTEKRVRIIHGKRATRVRPIEVILYVLKDTIMNKISHLIRLYTTNTKDQD